MTELVLPRTNASDRTSSPCQEGLIRVLRRSPVPANKLGEARLRSRARRWRPRSRLLDYLLGPRFVMDLQDLYLIPRSAYDGRAQTA